jgi:hypothetical protein
LRRGDDNALFRVLVATTMFQRRQDVQILRILRGIPAAAARELTTPRRLLTLVDASPCAMTKTMPTLLGTCDLSKDPRTKEGCCTVNSRVECHLKRHTVTLKRYGHFGKVPTSAALLLRSAGVSGLGALREKIYREHLGATQRAVALEAALSDSWRISSKIASMFLSALSNPDLAGPLGCWTDGMDWTHFVVIDSNVDAFLRAVRYEGLKTYDARRVFMQGIARRIDLRELRPGLNSYNPRLVQQAVYLFMSTTNRRTLAADCSREGAAACATCPRLLARQCSLRSH